MIFKVLCCEVFFREVSKLAAECPHTLDVEFLPKGLHDLGSDKMMPRLQERINESDKKAYDAVLLVYGLCNNGIVGLHPGKARLVVPKAHDCITMFMGNRTKYTDYFNAHPGTYYRTTGWVEHQNSSGEDDLSIQQKMGLFMKYEELVEKYGEDNAKYIMETMGSATAHYDRLSFIAMGLECEKPFIEKAREEAAEKGWKFEIIPGSLDILRKLLHGEWDDDFLVIVPGQTIRPSYDADVVKSAAGASRTADGTSK